jgi:hypothetical protein
LLVTGRLEILTFADQVAMIGRFARALFASCFLLTVYETELLRASQAEGSPENPAYQRVAANLDRGGVLYLYWSAEKVLGELDKKLQSIRELMASDPSLSPDEKNNLQKNFDLGIRLVFNSGLQKVKAVGLSSREIEPGFFLNKAFSYLPDRSGFVWDAFAKAPHDFPFLKMVPAASAGFAFFDFDLALLWSGISKEMAVSETPEVAKWQQRISQQVQAFTGLSLEDLLGSLGDQVGIIVTLDPEKTVRIPFGNEQFEMPEPAAALIWKVRNEKLFDRLDALFTMNPKVQKIAEPDVRMRVLEGVQEMPYLTPTMARYGEYLIIASSEMLVRGMIEADSGKTPGVRASPEFAKLSEDMPEKGNGVAYLGKRLQKTLGNLQMKLSQIREGDNPMLDAMSARLSGMSADAATYMVAGMTEDGWFTIGKATKDVNEILGELLTIPAYYFAIASVNETKQARGTDKLAKIKQNLADLRAAKEEAISEKNLQEGQMMTRQDVEEYITEWPQSLVGETYELGTVGEPPYATAPVDLGDYRSGSKIEP